MGKHSVVENERVSKHFPTMKVMLVSAMVAAVCVTGLGYAAAVPYAYKQYPYAPAAYYGKRSAEAEPYGYKQYPYAPAAYYGKRSAEAEAEAAPAPAEATGCRNFV